MAPRQPIGLGLPAPGRWAPTLQLSSGPPVWKVPNTNPHTACKAPHQLHGNMHQITQNIHQILQPNGSNLAHPITTVHSYGLVLQGLMDEMGMLCLPWLQYRKPRRPTHMASHTLAKWQHQPRMQACTRLMAMHTRITLPPQHATLGARHIWPVHRMQSNMPWCTPTQLPRAPAQAPIRLSNTHGMRQAEWNAPTLTVCDTPIHTHTAPIMGPGHDSFLV